MNTGLPDFSRAAVRFHEIAERRIPTPSNKSHVAMMIMMAKEAGTDDTLAAYPEYLRQIAPANGATLVKGRVQPNL